MSRKPCPKCGLAELDATAIHALLVPLDRYAKGHISVDRLREYINEAVAGNDDHDTAFSIPERIVRLLRDAPHGMTSRELAAAMGRSSEPEIDSLRSQINRLFRKRLITPDKTFKPYTWRLAKTGSVS